MIEIKISKDFTDTPGGRERAEGDYSGEQFREEILLPKYEDAEEQGEQLAIDFDDCFGFGTSFLEEAFGGLVREHHKKNILKRIVVISNEDKTIESNIKKYVKAAEKALR